ncbi:MAG TPA: ABC transporter ATP-binding protein [Phycisphaerae bacterium]|jgi:iron complex transport system ATP-binding protein
MDPSNHILPLRELSAKNLRYAYGTAADRAALDGVSFTLAPATLLAIVGPNGCGKSTLLKLLIGALTPQTGEITLDAKPLKQWGRIAIARRMALVPQMAGESTGSFAISGGGGFTVQQTVLMARYAAHVDEGRGILRAAGGLGIFGFESPADHQLATQAMWNADVHHLVDREIETLSGGERQRVAIARALAQQTPILLLDEPTSALDLYHQLELVEQMRSLITQGRLVILVTHDLNLAAACATRVIVMDQGRIAANGTPSQVLTPAVLEPVYHVKVYVEKTGLKFERLPPNS